MSAIESGESGESTPQRTSYIPAGILDEEIDNQVEDTASFSGSSDVGLIPACTLLQESYEQYTYFPLCVPFVVLGSLVYCRTLLM